MGYSRLQSAANYGMISLNPRYDWRNEHVAFAVGVKADVSFNNGTILRFSPDVRFDWTIVPDVQFYTAFTGGKKLNTWRSVSAYTLYFNPSAQVDNTYVPLDASLGIRINALPGFSIGLSGGYEICKKALFLLPEDLDGKFTGVSRFWGIDANALKAELDVSYRYGTKLEASAKVGYHRWKTADGVRRFRITVRNGKEERISVICLFARSCSKPDMSLLRVGSIQISESSPIYISFT